MNPSKPLTDADIVSLYLARDEAALEATERIYGGYCLSVAMNILENLPDAEECVNDTYLKAWNSIPPQKPTVLRLFLGKIVRNLAIDRYRKKKASGGSFSVTLEELAEILPAKEEDDRHLAAILEDFLSELSEEELEILTLYRRAHILPKKHRLALKTTIEATINMYLASHETKPRHGAKGKNTEK